MRVEARRIVHPSVMQEVAGFTIDKESHVSLGKMYKCEHSPIYTQYFLVKMYNIPHFVHVHFRTHHTGVVHFVKTNRIDRKSYSGDTGRMHPTNHCMFINAMGLINISRRRLCNKASPETRQVMLMIKDAISKIDIELATHMVSDCVYRKGCHELVPCDAAKLMWKKPEQEKEKEWTIKELMSLLWKLILNSLTGKSKRILTWGTHFKG